MREKTPAQATLPADQHHSKEVYFFHGYQIRNEAANNNVLKFEKELTSKFPADQKFAFENRNGVIVRQYSSEFCRSYNNMLKGMIERRMQQSIFAVASFWYTAWVDAGQPDLSKHGNTIFTEEDQKEFANLNRAWKSNTMQGRQEE